MDRALFDFVWVDPVALEVAIVYSAAQVESRLEFPIDTHDNALRFEQSVQRAKLKIVIKARAVSQQEGQIDVSIQCCVERWNTYREGQRANKRDTACDTKQPSPPCRQLEE